MTKSYELHLFTLTLWPEVIDSEQWEWRGKVKNTRSGEIRYFRDFHVLAQLLPVLLAEPSADEAKKSHAPNVSAPLYQEEDIGNE